MEKRIRSHISLPRNIIEKFENKDKRVYVFDLNRKHIFATDATKIGVEKGYYSEKGELFLSTEIESPFHNFVKKINSLSKFYEKTNFINKNSELIQKFFKLQFVRSKKVFLETKEGSKLRDTLEPIKHEDFIEIMSKLDPNILSLIEGDLFARIVINKSSRYSFINSSLGFYFTLKENKVDAFVIPISPQEAIYISKFVDDGSSYYYSTDVYTESLNKYCYLSENQIGNGFIVSDNEKNFDFVKNKT